MKTRVTSDSTTTRRPEYFARGGSFVDVVVTKVEDSKRHSQEFKNKNLFHYRHAAFYSQLNSEVVNR
jgi:hypothetical protein